MTFGLRYKILFIPFMLIPTLWQEEREQMLMIAMKDLHI